MPDSTFDEFFDNDFYSAPTSEIGNDVNTKNHLKNVRNSIQIKHSISTKSLKDITTNPNPSQQSNRQSFPTNIKAKRTSAIKASPSLKALENILNEKSKQYNSTSSYNVNAIVEEEEEEEDDGIVRQQTKLSPPLVFKYNTDVGQSVQTFETATESLDDEERQQQEEETDSNQVPESMESSIFSHNYLTKKTSKASSTTSGNSHKYNKSSISTISEAGYSTDETPIVYQPMTFQSITPHSPDSPIVKMIDVNEEQQFGDNAKVHENGQNYIIGNLDTNSNSNNKNNNIFANNGVTNYNTTSQKISTNYQQQEQQEASKSVDYLSCIDSHFNYQPQSQQQQQQEQPDDQDAEEMVQKNSHSLQPPRHIKLPSSNKSFLTNSSSSTISSSTTTSTTIATTNNKATTGTSIQSNNPFYQPHSNNNHYSHHQVQKQNFSSANPNVPAPPPPPPPILQQQPYSGTASTTSNTSNSVHRTISNLSSSNMSIESNNSSLNKNNSNSEHTTRPKIVRKSKSMLEVLSNSESLENIQKSTSPLPETPKQYFAGITTTGPGSTASSPKKSPHLRSNSAFSLNFISKETTSNTNTMDPPRHLQHKRSSTMSDLSRLNHTQPSHPQQQQSQSQPQPQPQQQSTAASVQSSTFTNNTLTSSTATNEKKKFSFKSLFKSRSKNHSLNSALEPKKLTSKSYSTPNMQTLSEQPKKVEQKQQQDDHQRPQMKTTNSFMNRFMKTKSSENLSKMGALQEPKKTLEANKPVDQHTKKEPAVASNSTVSSNSAPTTNENFKNKNSAKETTTNTTTSTTNKSKLDAMAPPTQSLARPGSVNFIREISEDSVFVGKHNIEVHDDIEDEHSGDDDRESFESGEDNYDQLSYSRSVPEDEDFDYYDAKNISDNPPQKLNKGNQYGEEIALLPPLLDSNQFGSPFKVNYQNSPQSSSKGGETQGQNLDDSPLLKKKLQSPSMPIKPPHSQNPLANRGLDHNHHHNSNNSNQLLGEALFPKSLNAHEVESIVSLERSRSMKSVKSNKRNSFVNYDGSDDNIVHYVGPTSQPNSNSGMTRSNSILKNSTSRRSNLNEELNMNSIDANISQYAEELNHSNHNLNTSLILDDDLMEFSQFIDVDNLNFVDSPLLPGTPKRSDGQVGIPPPSPLDLKSFDKLMPHPSSVQEQQQVQQQKKSPVIIVDKSEVEEPKINKNAQISIDSRTPPSSSSPLSMEHVESPKTSVEGNEQAHEKEVVVIDLTNDSSGVGNSITTPEPKNETDDEDEDGMGSDAATEIIKSSPILQSAYMARRSQDYEEDGDGSTTKPKVRPISMSFKGMNAPSFSGKFKSQDLRSSDSHQSFNINFNDDSSSSVGGGFGTTTDDEDYESEDLDDSSNVSSKRDGSINQGIGGRKISPLIPPQTNMINKHSPLVPPSAGPNPAAVQSPTTSVKSSVFSPRQSHKKSSASPTESNHPQQGIPQPPAPPRKFSHNKIPSISDQSSVASGSPRSFTSMISKKWGNNKKSSPASSPRAAPLTHRPPQVINKISNGVRFSSRIILYDTYNEDEYDRHPDTATCNQLTPLLAQQIKEELNTFKSEMNIHVESRCYTHFF